MSGMKRSTVEMLIRKKVKTWLATIVDENVRKVAEDSVIITGGCIPSMLMGEKINDYDCYFKSLSAVHMLANYYVDIFNKTKGQLKAQAMHSCNPTVERVFRKNIMGEKEERVLINIRSAGVASEGQSEYKYFEGFPENEAEEFMSSFDINEDKMDFVEGLNEDIKVILPEYRPIFFSDNAISLKGRIQLIVRFHGDVEKIHRNFDFVHAHCSYDYKEHKLILPSASLESMMSKALIYNGSLYPLASMFRVRKFLARGWRITAGQMLKIAHQISNIDLNDREILREQLIGVDQAYMSQLLNELQKTSGKVDGTYLAKLIDEIFE